MGLEETQIHLRGQGEVLLQSLEEAHLLLLQGLEEVLFPQLSIEGDLQLLKDLGELQ